MYHPYFKRATHPSNQRTTTWWGYEPRRTIINRARYSPIALMEDPFHEMDSHFDQLRWNMNSVFDNLPGFDRNGLVLKPELSVDEGQKKYCLSVQVGNFLPKNVKVSLKDRVMMIEAKTAEKSEDGTSRVYQEFSRQFNLPGDIDLTELKSVLTPEGVLKVEAPLAQQALQELPRPVEIPIQFL